MCRRVHGHLDIGDDDDEKQSQEGDWEVDQKRDGEGGMASQIEANDDGKEGLEKGGKTEASSRYHHC